MKLNFIKELLIQNTLCGFYGRVLCEIPIISFKETSKMNVPYQLSRNPREEGSNCRSFTQICVHDLGYTNVDVTASADLDTRCNHILREKKNDNQH